MNRLTFFGERIKSLDPARQTAEIQIRIAIMNRFSALGRAEIKAIARTAWESAHSLQTLNCAISPSRKGHIMLPSLGLLFWTGV